MAKIIKVTQSDLRRLVEKVIKEDCGGSGFVEPQESSDRLNRYNKFQEEMEIAEQSVDDDDVDTDEDIDTDEEEEEEVTRPGISGGSGKFSDKDVTDVKLFNDGKKQFNQLTINQKTLVGLLGYTDK
tara:strand:- start:219 stop:599 length:381 start_codon:yes stop_codon:yes gene_type:complete